jgi:hypothetical protein
MIRGNEEMLLQDLYCKIEKKKKVKRLHLSLRTLKRFIMKIKMEQKQKNEKERKNGWQDSIDIIRRLKRAYGNV